MKIYSEREVEKWVAAKYGIRGKAVRLAGEVDQNFFVEDENKRRFTAKISPSDCDTDKFEFQDQMRIHMRSKGFQFQLPEPVKSLHGLPWENLEEKISEGSDILRLQTWVDGKMIADHRPWTISLLYSWGELAGEVSRTLEDFDHQAAHYSYKWNPSELLQWKDKLPYIINSEGAEIIRYFFSLFEHQVLPVLGDMRKSVNHNDIHEHNLIIEREQFHPSIHGIIDFGDAIKTETINELAVSCAYACMYSPDPLRVARIVVAGYHSIFPIQEKELSVLYGLIAARLCITVLNAASQRIQNPENNYLQISEEPAWNLLRQWYGIEVNFAHFSFRASCNLDPHPEESTFTAVMMRQNSIHPVVMSGSKSYATVDLSVGSPELGNFGNYQTIEGLQEQLEVIRKKNNADLLTGGYGEIRVLYSDPSFETKGFYGHQRRVVHLGLDIWDATGTAVYLPVAGKIHSCQNNTGDKNYGPTIIVEHEIDSIKYFTLYGHLSTDSLNKYAVGTSLEAGDIIGYFGNYKENGGWPPHLHFQVILDGVSCDGDYPGVCFSHEWEVYRSICPDPLIISGLDIELSQNRSGSDQDKLLAYRHKHLGKSLSLSYKSPIQIVRGQMQYLIDIQGRWYLDTVNNVAHVGHEHPAVLHAIVSQINLLNTNTRYLHPSLNEFAEELLRTLPDSLSVVHFVNSGSEANELALRMCEAWTGSRDMLVVEAGYHGNTGRCIDISSYKFDGKGGAGKPPTTHVIPLPDTFRGKYRKVEDAGAYYASFATEALKELKEKGKEISGFICESILSCGGQIVLPSGYLREVYKAVRNAGGLCIADEVQVGLGRAGDRFWGFELQEVTPDIVTIGKPLGNGHPVAAVVCTEEVADAFANGMEYFNTFGGNPVSCAAGTAVLKVVRNEHLMEHARTLGNYILGSLRALQEKHPIIGDVRGHGLFIGFELVKGAGNETPATEEAKYLKDRMRELGVLMSTDGPDENVIKIKPPMCIKQHDIDYMIECLDQVLSESALQIGRL